MGNLPTSPEEEQKQLKRSKLEEIGKKYQILAREKRACEEAISKIDANVAAGSISPGLAENLKNIGREDYDSFERKLVDEIEAIKL